MYTKAITKMENRAAKGYIVGPMEKSMRELSNRACEKAKETGSAKITIFTKDIIARTEKMEQDNISGQTEIITEDNLGTI